MQYVTAVDPYWLAEMGPMFFSIKECFGPGEKVKMLEQKVKMEQEMKTIQEALQRTKTAPQSVEQPPDLFKKPKRSKAALHFYGL
jgi:pre-mRNA-splicing factor ATP-dependent RNA helicase DHX38/PRP16